MAQYVPDSDSEDELPPGWEERAALDGSVYYVNHATKATQWNHPRTGKKKLLTGDLPPNWEKKVDELGRVVYVDVSRNQKTFTDPRLAFAKEINEKDMAPRQRFDGSSTALQVLLGSDLSGKTILVTGATNGIGFETARSLALHGAHVIISGRSETTSCAAQAKLLEERPHAKTSVLPMELTSLKSVRLAALHLLANFQSLDVVILNAGVFAVGFQTTEDDLNLLFQVNYLSQFYLMLYLDPLLQPGARVVIVSSESHRQSSLKRENLSLERLSPSVSSQYWDIMAYNHSKLCNVLHCLELSERLSARQVLVYSLHPGSLMNTGIAKKNCFFRVLFALLKPFTKSMQQGAATTVFCAVAPEVEDYSGHYFNNCCLTSASPAGRDRQLATQLWNLTMELLVEKNVPLPTKSTLVS